MTAATDTVHYAPSRVWSAARMWEEPSPPRDQTLSPVSARQAGNSMAGSTLQNSVSPSPVHFAQETTYSAPQV